MLLSFETWFIHQLGELDFIGMVALWVSLICLPLIAPVVSYVGFSSLFTEKVSKREDVRDLGLRLGMAFGGFAVSIVCIAAWAAILRHFKEALSLTLATGGDFLRVSLACLVALPVGWVGYELRMAATFLIRKTSGPRRASAGVIVLGALSAGLYNYVDSQTWKAFSVGVLVTSCRQPRCGRSGGSTYSCWRADTTIATKMAMYR